MRMNTIERSPLLLGQTDENISAIILEYLKTSKSNFFEFHPKDPVEESVIRMFENCTDELLKNKLRNAVYLCIEQENLFKCDPLLTKRLLNLVDEMRVIKAKRRLLEFAKTIYFTYIPIDISIKLKNKVISTLITLNTNDYELRDVIDANISNPFYTDVCLSAAACLTPRFDSFIKYFSIGLQIYEKNKDTSNLDSVFRIFLRKIGIEEWIRRGKDFLLGNTAEFESKLGLLFEAGLCPLVYDSDESLIELIFKWPYEDEEHSYRGGSIILTNLTDVQIEIMRKITTEMTVEAPQEEEIISDKDLFIYAEPHYFEEVTMDAPPTSIFVEFSNNLIIA